jgi:zinc/manganese transport system permease protein
MFDYEFMVNAFAAASIVAVAAGLVGYFLVIRGQTFAGHALSHVGFAGATGAVLIGVPPLAGLLLATVAAGAGMGLLGERFQQRDVAIGIVLAASLGLGLLFLHFFTAYASQATALLFGNVLGVSVETVFALLALSLVTIGALAAISRPLLFATLQPELAEAKGVSLKLVSVLFLVIVALATAASVQIVGILLVFTLMVAPAAAAQRLTIRLWPGLALSVILALIEAWGGLTLAYYTDWPTSFWITALGAVIYLSAHLGPRHGAAAHAGHAHAGHSHAGHSHAGHGHDGHGHAPLAGHHPGPQAQDGLSQQVKNLPAQGATTVELKP